jgi:hypothetical protein
MEKGMRASANAAVAVFIISIARMAQSAPPRELEPLSFLLGGWEAENQGRPDEGSGRTVFSRSLQDRVILRTNDAEYPASGDKPASRHDDLMVIYVAAGTMRADYYDSEGHLIRYLATSPAAGQALFVSDPVDGEPRYRLRYELAPGGSLKGEFAIAPPGEPDSFRPYLSWQSRRRDEAK